MRRRSGRWRHVRRFLVCGFLSCTPVSDTYDAWHESRPISRDDRADRARDGEAAGLPRSAMALRSRSSSRRSWLAGFAVSMAGEAQLGGIRNAGVIAGLILGVALLVQRLAIGLGPATTTRACRPRPSRRESGLSQAGARMGSLPGHRPAPAPQRREVSPATSTAQRAVDVRFTGPGCPPVRERLGATGFRWLGVTSPVTSRRHPG